MPIPSPDRPTAEPGRQAVRADARRNRTRILTAARQIVASEGVAAQVQDVARQAGVGVGTVYRHFPTKEALMSELVRECMTENLQLARDCLQMQDPWEAFATFVRTACRHMAEDASVRRAWFATSAEVLAHVADIDQELRQALAGLIERAQLSGALRRSFTIEDMPLVMRSLAGMLDALGLDPATGDQWPRIVDVVLDGLHATPVVTEG
jgi:AcrR family transcriptional regulator